MVKYLWVITMKLLLVIIANEDAVKTSNALLLKQFFVTKIASTGGLLANGNTTLLVGTDDNKVEEAIEVISKHSKTRKKSLKEGSSILTGVMGDFPTEIVVSGATIFVLNVEKSVKL